MDVGRLVGQNQLDQRLSDDMEEDVSSFLSRIESAKSHYAGSLTGITAPSFDSFPNMTGGQSRARGSLQALKGSNSGTDGGASEDSSVAEEIPRGAHELSYMGLNGALHPDPILDRMKVSTPNTDCTPPQSVEEPRVKLLAYSFGDELGDYHDVFDTAPHDRVRRRARRLTVMTISALMMILISVACYYRNH